MNYTASISDYFKNPKWMMNTLLAGVCVFIPLVGPIVIKGWLLTGFWGRQDERCETFPEFDFNKFGKYLERGLWPFLVTLVSSLILTVALCFFIVPIVMLTTMSLPHGDSSAGSCVAIVMFLFLMVVYLVALVFMMLVLTPLTIRASLIQDFGQSFNFAFIKRFISLTWKESILSTLFLIAASFVLTGAGLLLLCVGAYFATVPVYFCWVHLHKQLYGVYLSRGGEPLPVSPKLQDDLAPAAI